MNEFPLPARVAANIARRDEANRPRVCVYGCLAHVRMYACGARCDLHAPWALAGQPDPASQVDPARTLDALRNRMQHPAELRAMCAQSAHDDHTVPGQPTGSIDQRFALFDQTNPHIRTRLVQLVEHHLSQGARRLSIGALFEELRGTVETTGQPYALDNSLRSVYVRALIADRPDWASLFELRQRRSVA